MSSCKTKDSLYREQSRQMWFLLSLLNIILCQRKFFSISKCLLWHKLPPLLASAKVHVWDFSKKCHKTRKLWRRVNWKSSMIGILIHILWLKFWIIVSAQGIFPFQHLKSSENNYIITPSSKKKYCLQNNYREDLISSWKYPWQTKSSRGTDLSHWGSKS